MDTKKLKITIVNSTYNNLTISLVEHAHDSLLGAGILRNNIKSLSVKGFWEIPVVCANILDSSACDGIIVYLDVLFDTPHLEEMLNVVTKKIMDLSVDSKVPIVYEFIVGKSIKEMKDRVLINDLSKPNFQVSSLLSTFEVLKNI